MASINNHINNQANYGAIIAYGLIAMNRADLIARLAESHPKLQIKDAELGAKVIIDALSNTLLKGGRVEVRGFGSFSLNYRPPRQRLNPKTGGKVQVPAKYVPHFKAGKELKERVDFK
jgi:integration host factor subunit beta